MKKLIISEKPSVAQSLAKVLGVRGRKDGYIEGKNYIVTWCIGHLVGTANPEAYGEEYKDWSKLPIIPTEWKYQVLSGTKKQFDIIKRLMKSKDVGSVVCATDAGREGELIFRLVYNEAKCTKPIERLWISSLEDNAIKQGFENLKPGTEFDNLYKSALCRERADWLIGINASRYYTVKNKKTTSIGRVQTPTLSMIAQRDKDINDFVKGYYYTVEVSCKGMIAQSDKYENKENAVQIANSLKNVTVTDIEKENKSVNPPKLYDLTSLQRDANKILGFTAQETLEMLQKLYEAKLVTYPRTDSCYLTEDMEQTAIDVINVIVEKMGFATATKPDINPVMNNKKVSDHHAIIPTINIKGFEEMGLNEKSRNLLILISARLLTATAPKHTYESTVITLKSDDTEFKAKGKTIVSQGFKVIENEFYRKINYKSTEDEQNIALPTVSKDEKLLAIGTVKEHETKPPKQYTEDTLLSAMEKAGNKEYTEEVERKGLGTPATRASIIETLIKRGYVERKGKCLIVTDKGKELINTVPEKLQSASMTAEWENKLSLIAQGKSDSDSFMQGIQEFVKEIVNQ